MKATQKTLLTVLGIAAAGVGLWYMTKDSSPALAEGSNEKVDTLNAWSGGNAPAWTKKAVSIALAQGSQTVSILFNLITKVWPNGDAKYPYTIDAGLNPTSIRQNSIGAWWENFVSTNKLY